MMTSPDSSPPRPPVRVILVGRTGVDHLLRNDPAVELIRARNAFDVLGELSERVGGGARTAGVRGDAAFDAVLSPDAPAAVVRAALVDGEEPVADSRGSVDGGGAAVGDAPAVGGDDGELVHLMMRGLDIVPTALELIRRRTGDAGVSLEPGGAGVEVRAEPHGAVVGWLQGRALPREALEAQARWLGAWMSLAAQHAELRDAALRDPVTGAWNRRYLDRFLPVAIEESARRRHALTLLLFDIDNFKTFNDTYGHSVGDEVLREIVRLLEVCTRPQDRICRYGGDEFVVVFYEPDGPRDPGSTHPASVFDIAARFQQAVFGQAFPLLGSNAPGTLTISGGLATYPWDGRTAEELVARADQLAYRSKEMGKNVITVGAGANKQRGG